MSESYLHIVKSLAKIYDHLENFTRDESYTREMIEEVKEYFLVCLKDDMLKTEEIKRIAYMIYCLPRINCG